MTDYAELRAALKSYDPDDTSTWAGFWEHATLPTIRTLLAERDALRATTQELIDAAEGCFFGSGYNPAGTLRSAVNAARAALAQEQGD